MGWERGWRAAVRGGASASYTRPPMAPADVISFARGAPSADILPAAAVREAAARALETTGSARFIRHRDGPPRACRVDRRASRIDPAQVMVTNGSMEAAASSSALLEPGDRVIVEQPSYDRTLLLLARAGSSSSRSRSRPTASTSTPSRRRSRRPGEARPHHPQLPQPSRLHALGGKRRRLAAGGRARLHPLRGRPLPPDLIRLRGARDDALARPGGQGPPRLLVLEDGQPRRPRRLPRR